MKNKKQKLFYGLVLASYMSTIMLTQSPSAFASVYSAPTLDKTKELGLTTYGSGYSLNQNSSGTINIPTYDAVEKALIDHFYDVTDRDVTYITSHQSISNNSSYGDYLGKYFKGVVYSGAGGSALRIESSTVGNIEADFLNNVSTHKYGGGALSIKYGTIASLTGDFIANIAEKQNGGAITISSSTITTLTGNFINNEAQGSLEEGYGGGIYVNLEALITNLNANFIGNKAKSGGAIYRNSGSIINISGDFINNSAIAGSGGAIYSATDTGSLGDFISNFVGNTATQNGGAINMQGGSLGTVTGDFVNNQAGQNGGAIYTKVDITKLESDFIGNNAQVGGAIYRASGTITDIEGSFSNNYATGNTLSNGISGDGGAIYNAAGAGSIVNINADFTGNVAGYNNDVNIGSGGAIYNAAGSGSYTATISNITGNFTENHAKSSGGAIYNAGTIESISGNFEGNYTERETAAGGAIYNDSGTIGTITGNFIGNYTLGATANKAQGGAISNRAGATITEINGNFINNRANIGGAITNKESSVITTINANFTGNYTTNSGSGKGFGGAIYNASTIENINGDFTENHALNQGGAIYNDSGTITSLIGDFIGNYSNVGGGAIYNKGTGANIHISSTADRGVEFTGNYVKSGTDSAVSNAIYNSGTIYLDANSAHNIIVNDAVTGSNGVLYINGSGGTGIVEFNNSVTGNSVYLQGGTLRLGSHTYTTAETTELAGQTGIGSLTNLTTSGSSTLSTINNEIMAASVGNLTMNNDLNWTFDIDLSNSTVDTISMTSLTSNSHNIIIDAINFIADSSSGQVDVVLTTTASDSGLYTLSDIIASNTVAGVNYNYYVDYSDFGNWTDGSASGLDADKGILRFTRIDLPYQVHNDETNKTYALLIDEEISEDLGLLHGTSLSITGNNHAINGNSEDGIILGDNTTQSLTIDGVSSYNGFGTVAITNKANGTLTISNSTFENNTTADIDNGGTLNLSGTNEFETIIDTLNSGSMTVTEGTTTVGSFTQNSLTTAGEATLTNNGASTVVNGTNAGTINGTGSLTNTGVFTNNGSIAQTIVNNGTFTNNGSGITGNVTNTSGTFTNNSTINGNVTITNGTFVENANVTGYIDIETNGTLECTTTIASELKNVTGNGTLNKYGAQDLTFDETYNTFAGTANIYAGNLVVQGNATDSFGFSSVIKGGNLVYTAKDAVSQITIGGSGTNVSFNGSGNATFTGKGTNKTTFVLDSIAGITGTNNVTINSSNIQFNQANYTTGQYEFNNSMIDLADDSYSNIHFGNLNLTGTNNLSLDVNLGTLPNTPQSDTIQIDNGNGNLSIVLSEINVHNATTNNGDNGLNNTYSFNVLTGDSDVVLSSNSVTTWATNAYVYDVDLTADLKGIIMTQNSAANENSLKYINQISGTRGFSFTNDDDNPYVIGSSLGNTAAGTVTILGNNATISGNNNYSMFNVVNNTDLKIENVTIEDASGTTGSVLNVNNENAKVLLDNVTLVDNNSTGNGGAINNVSSSQFVIDSSSMSNNHSDGLGGAIYTSSNMTISNSDFGTTASNSDSNGANDIYIDGATVTFSSTDTAHSINSGIAGNGTLAKTGAEDLNLSGQNSNFSGTLSILAGDLNYTQSSSTDSYISGVTQIASGSTVNITNNESDLTAGSFSGEGNLTKDGDYNLNLTGDNSLMTGNVTVNDGSIVYDSDTVTKYFSGSTILNSNGQLVVDGDNSSAVSQISGNGKVTKNGDGQLTLNGDNSGFAGDITINNGELAFGAGSSLGKLNNITFADNTSLNLQNTTAVNEDGSWTTDPNPASIENLEYTTITLNGKVNLAIDVDLKNQLADNISADNVEGNGYLFIDGQGINVVSDSLLTDTIVQIAGGVLAQNDNYIQLADDAKIVMGPIQKYDVTYSGGMLGFTRRNNPSDFNPAVMASSVATQIGGHLTQLETLHDGFFHMDRYTKYKIKDRYLAENINKYAINDVPPYQYSNIPETSQAMWIKPYTTFEKVSLRGGTNVSNIMYGALYGGDSPLYDLKNGWKGVISAFVGYNGSHQEYSTISMNQQGGTLGVTATAYKGGFFTGITASAGGSAGEAYTKYGHDNFSMITAGIASKTGYNFEFKEGKVVLQPSLFLGYTFVNTFDYKNSAGVKIDSDPLNSMQIIPGLKLIGNLKDGWQPYAGVDMVWNVMGKTNVMANDVKLPQLSVKPYVEYGVGLQKTCSENFTAYGQAMVRNGGRNGIALTAGFRWALGRDSDKKNFIPVNSKKKRQIFSFLRKNNDKKCS